MIVTALAVALMGGVASCGDDDASDLPPPASPPSTTDQTPGLDLSPAEQQAVDEAQAKFDEFMNAYIDVSTADIPTADEAEDLFAQVDQHIAPGVLSQELRTEIIGRWGEGDVADGVLAWETSDQVDVDLERELDGADFPTVYIGYCVDATDWRPGEADENGGRNLWAVSLAWSADWSGFGEGRDGWRVTVREVRRDQPC